MLWLLTFIFTCNISIFLSFPHYNHTALQQSIELAKQIAAFPQRCLRADRMSTYYSTYQAESLQDAMDFEYKTGRSYAYTLVKPDYLYGGHIPK